MKFHRKTGGGLRQSESLFAQRPGFLTKTIQELLPGLLFYPELVFRLQRYLFTINNGKPGGALLMEEVRQLLQPEEEVLKFFFDSLEGMRLAIKRHDINSPEELEVFLDTSRNDFLKRFPGLK